MRSGSTRMAAIALIIFSLALQMLTFIYIIPSSEHTGGASTTEGQVSLCFNTPPAITQQSDITASVGSTVSGDVDATDVNSGSTIIFFDNTTLFDIDNSTGIFSFTALAADTGTHHIRVSAIDNSGCPNANSSMEFFITIVAAAAPAPAPAGGGGGFPAPSCSPELIGCSEWSDCLPGNLQVRTCDHRTATCQIETRSESRFCLYIPPITPPNITLPGIQIPPIIITLPPIVTREQLFDVLFGLMIAVALFLLLIVMHRRAKPIVHRMPKKHHAAPKPAKRKKKKRKRWTAPSERPFYE